jgi:competence protein ComEC
LIGGHDLLHGNTGAKGSIYSTLRNGREIQPPGESGESKPTNLLVQREPLLLPVLALSAGILAGHFNYFRAGELVWPLTLAVSLIVVCLAWRKAYRLRLACVLLAIGILGLATQVAHRKQAPPKLNVSDGETVLLDGCVVDPPVFSPDKAQFSLQLAPGAEARVSVVLKGDAALPIGYGQRIEAVAKVRSPHNFQNPGEFDYAAWLANQHIYWTASVHAPEDIHLQPGRCGHRAIGWLFSVRTWSLNRLDELYPGDHETAVLLKAILLGQTAGVERRWTNDFRLTGTYHALVISGQHISVLAITLLFLLRLLNFGRIPSLAVAAGASWLYAFVSGCSAPVLRAAGGFTLFLIASYLFRRLRILNTLAVVAFAYLVFDPKQLFDASFQLSFLSAAALAVFAIPLMERWTEPLRMAASSPDRMQADMRQDARIATWRVELRLLAETLRLWSRLPGKASIVIVGAAARLLVFIAEAMIVSACIQFGLALPMADYFHRVSFTGLVANVIVVPLLSVVVPVGFAAIFTGWHWLGAIAAFCLHTAESVAAWHVKFEPGWRIAALPVWLGLAFTTSLILLAFSLRRKNRLTPLVALLSIGLFGVMYWQPWRPDLLPGWLEISAIDVGQGDSLLVAFPNGRTMLIDGGGFPGMSRMARKPNLDIGEDVVSPYLWSRKIRRLDYAVLTHGHSDHMAGMGAVLDNFRPRVLWIGVEPDTPAWRALKEKALHDGVRIQALGSTTKPFQIGSANVTVLAPMPDYVAGDIPANDDSVVLQIGLGRRRVLLTGDAEKPIEGELLSEGKLQPVTLLKAGHHGSRTSSSEAFIDAVRPEFTMISAGYLNQFHHPHPQVLERFAEHHTMVLRTDREGLLTFRTDGERVVITTPKWE